ncbi:hypothetical protein [Caldisericum exile]|uniref:Hypothetical membrane protein n=1 Tax=Caldisericum exile (strain DSM 21853 / NBRC 104410 / AZM16c01) TaxID=511051 RepID=A0A7U6GDN3_CALEA|nr:hypothetical protein [Caldisericum exile]BAL80488.1 hypothetical membrane protein [Caldisericum exile AZM16c01]
MKEKFTPHRAYRKVKIEKKEIFSLIIATLLIVLVIYFFLPKITIFWASFTIKYINLTEVNIVKTQHFHLYTLDIPGKFPSTKYSVSVLIVSIVMLLFLFLLRPHMIKYFFVYIDLILVASSIYFIFFKQLFPYNLTKLLEMLTYIQASILILIPIIGFMSTVFFKTKFYKKLLFVVSILVYAIVFHTLRFATFVYITKNFSYLFTPLLFFVFGPYFDAIYFVAFFSLFVASSVKQIEKEAFQW